MPTPSHWFSIIAFLHFCTSCQVKKPITPTLDDVLAHLMTYDTAFTCAQALHTQDCTFTSTVRKTIPSQIQRNIDAHFYGYKLCYQGYLICPTFQGNMYVMHKKDILVAVLYGDNYQVIEIAAKKDIRTSQIDIGIEEKK